MELNQIDTAYLIKGIFVLSATFIFYTMGVWESWIRKRLSKWHVAFFLLAMITDAVGTSLMEQMAQSAHLHYEAHTLSGILAILILFVHACWSVWTYVHYSRIKNNYFVKYSIFIWCIWLIPFITGIYWGAK